MALLSMALTVGTTACGDDDPDYENVVPPTVAQVHNISGSIAGIDGKGIAGATVTMSGTANATATTNGNGYFIFEDVATGAYKLSVAATGKLSKETNVNVTENGKGQNVVWNVMLASEEAVTNIAVSNEKGGEGQVTTEALKGNEKAEIPVEVTVAASALSKEATIEVAPIYSEAEATASRAAANTMVVGAKLSCADNSVKIENPIDLVFNVDEVTTSEVKAQKYVNGAWVDVPSHTENGKVIVAADEFTAYGLFASINFSISSKNQTVNFAQNIWDNLYGSNEMSVSNASYTYKVGMDINTSGTTVFTALLIEALARQFGANSYETQGNYPINVTLPIGTYLRIDGVQQVNAVTASVGKRSVTGTQYGDVTITTTTANRQHTGGSNK